MIGSVLRARYEVSSLIQEGPVFVTYGGRDRLLNREASIRIVKVPFKDEPEFIASLRQAAQDLVPVRAPQIAQIWEVEQGDGAAFLVGEAIRGQLLIDRIKKLAPFSILVSVSMAISILNGVDMLHQADRVHGDISPYNVTILPDGAARLEMAGIWRSYSSSETAGVVVLPYIAAYLAPEVTAGAMPSRRSDVYSAAVVLYQLITGRLPYRADTPVSMAVKHATEPIPSIKAIVQSAPTALDELLKKAMAKDPSQRYQSGAEMLADLRMIQDALRFGRPLTWPLTGAPAPRRTPTGVAPRMSAVRRTTRPRDDDEAASRDVPLWLLGAIGVAALAFLGFVGFWIIQSVNKPRMVAIPNLQNMTSTEAREAATGLHLKFRIVGRKPNDRVPMDSVVDEFPSAGSRVREGTEISVTLSTGSTFVQLPDLRGRTVDDARRVLASLDVAMDDRVSQAPDATVAAGKVASQDPPAGSRVKRSSQIHIVTSSGPPKPTGERARYAYSLKVDLSNLQSAVTLRVDMVDAHGSHTVYEQEQNPGDVIPISVVASSPSAMFRVYYDDMLVNTLRPKPVRQEPKPKATSPDTTSPDEQPLDADSGDLGGGQ